MTSPSKILLLALCVAAFVAYFGEQLITVSQKVDQKRQQADENSANELVYEETRMANSSGEIRVPMNRDGHYWVTIDVNHTPVRFVVDTGASHVSLSYEDAVSIGLDPDGLNFNRVFNTANGTTNKAIIKLDRLTLGPIELSDIPASVSQQGRMDVSLLGMNFLNRLSSFKIENKELILKP